MHYGDNGILKGAEYAVDKYKNTTKEEENIFSQSENYIESLVSNRDGKFIPMPYITLSGPSGNISQEKELIAGTYAVECFVTCFSWWSNCPHIEVYSDSELILSIQGNRYNETKGASGTVFACGGSSSTLKLEQNSMVYAKIVGGKYWPHGMVNIFRIE